MNSTAKYDLAIVGGGIAGPALAAALADSGLQILLVERSTKPLDTTRGDQLQPSTCDYFERWGVLDMMLERGAEKRLGSRWLTADGELVCSTRVDNLDLKHPYFLYLNHELISEVLLERARQNPNFTLLQPARAKLLKDAAGPGEHALRTETDAESRTVAARCIAIADGRMSANRKLLEIDAEVYQYKNPLLILFAERDKPDPRNDLKVLLTPTGIVSVVPRTGGSCKIGLPVDRKELGHWNDASDDEVRERLSAIAPALSDLRPSVSGVYPVAMVNAARWSDGNCVLLGDACHALHPGRSQGMNIAFANVASLAQRMQTQNWQESQNAIVQLLTDFEAQERPAIDARLADNHVRGLEMDNIDPQQSEQTIAALKQLAASPEKLHQYCLNAAGY